MNGQAARRLLALPVWVTRLISVGVFAGVWELAARRGMLNPLFVGQPSRIAVFFLNGFFVDQRVPQRRPVDAGGYRGRVRPRQCRRDSGRAALRGLARLRTVPRADLRGPQHDAPDCPGPPILLWFGLGIGSEIALAFSLTFFIVLGSTVAGARGVDPDHIRLARTLGAGPALIFRKVALISAVPTIFSGLRLGLVYALLGVIGGEIIAAQHGLGQYLSYLAGTFQTNGVFAVLLLLGLIGAVLMRLMGLVEARPLRWR
jgi:NitT/TauT family transport system permease protein